MGLALIGAGTRRSALASVTAFVLIGVRRNVFGIRLAGSGPRVPIALFSRSSALFGRIPALFLLSCGWHNISNRYPSNEATDMPFAEALM
jgi:hypothetical protein